MRSSTGPRFESRLTARLLAGPPGAMTKLPTKTQSAETGSKYPTHRARACLLTNGTARSTAPKSQASSPRAKATTNPKGVGDEPGRLVGQPRQHERAVEAQEKAEKHPRHLDQRKPDQSGQPAFSGHPGVEGGQPQEHQRGAHGAESVERHPKARLRRDGGFHARAEHGPQDDVQDERDGAEEDQEATDSGEPHASHR